jgi:hypothetical protein
MRCRSASSANSCHSTARRWTGVRARAAGRPARLRLPSKLTPNVRSTLALRLSRPRTPTMSPSMPGYETPWPGPRFTRARTSDTSSALTPWKCRCTTGRPGEGSDHARRCERNDQPWRVDMAGPSRPPATWTWQPACWPPSRIVPVTVNCRFPGHVQGHRVVVGEKMLRLRGQVNEADEAVTVPGLVQVHLCGEVGAVRGDHLPGVPYRPGGARKPGHTLQALASLDWIFSYPGYPACPG